MRIKGLKIRKYIVLSRRDQVSTIKDHCSSLQAVSLRHRNLG
jgi:hypothetical protein